MKKHYLSICLITKDSHDYIEEWIDYHLKIGIDHIYIYDDGSELPLYGKIHNIVKNYGDCSYTPNTFENSKITYEYQNIPKPSQMITYQRCLKDHAVENQWLAFIDDDEFLFSKQKPIKELLKDYEDFGALGVNWFMFGSSGYFTKQKSVLKSYLQRTSEEFIENVHIKSIVNTDYVDKDFIPLDPHHFHFFDGRICVNENYHPIINTPFNPKNTYDKIQLNHYVTRSFEDFNNKNKRGYGDQSAKLLSIEFFDNINNNSTIYDNSINEQECLK